MSRELRPRPHRLPKDHNYSHMPGTLNIDVNHTVVSENKPATVNVPQNCELSKLSDNKPPFKREVKEESSEVVPKKKRRRYFGEKRKKRSRKPTTKNKDKCKELFCDFCLTRGKHSCDENCIDACDKKLLLQDQNVPNLLQSYPTINFSNEDILGITPSVSWDVPAENGKLSKQTSTKSKCQDVCCYGSNIEFKNGESSTRNDNPSSSLVIPPSCVTESQAFNASCSTEIDVKDQLKAIGKSHGKVGKFQRCSMRRFKCSSCKRRLKQIRRKLGESHRRQSSRLVLMNYKLPFNDLPYVVKIFIFQLLNPEERAIAAKVCKEWYELAREPSVWFSLDLNFLDPPPSKIKMTASSISKDNKVLSTTRSLVLPWLPKLADYVQYKEKLAKYFKFLNEIEPCLECLRFKFDLAQESDGWRRLVLDLLKTSQCKHLKELHANWCFTPKRPPSAEKYCCVFSKVQKKFLRHQTRGRVLFELLSTLSMVSPYIKILSLPFFWHPRAVLLLSRFKHLESLHLQKYLTMTAFDRPLFSVLLENLSSLQHLHLEVCIGKLESCALYEISHPTLLELDLRGCQGFFLRRVNLPLVRSLKVSRLPWGGHVTRKERNRLPCLYYIIRDGMPNVSQINRHHLHGYWKDFLYQELDVLLDKVCYCKKHLYKPVAQANQG